MPKRRSAPYDAQFVEQARAFAEQRRPEGRTWDQLGDELGVLGETLRRWCTPRKRAKRTMRAIEIVSREAHGSSVIVFAPSGLRVEGLSLDEIVALLRALG